MIRRLIDMQAAAEIGGPSMQSYGTSEGVTKAWDTRGRHQDFGSFKKTSTASGHFRSLTRYESPHSIVNVQEPQSGRGAAVVREYKKPDVEQVDKQYGPVSGLKGHLESRYGINHGGAIPGEDKLTIDYEHPGRTDRAPYDTGIGRKRS